MVKLIRRQEVPLLVTAITLLSCLPWLDVISGNRVLISLLLVSITGIALGMHNLKSGTWGNLLIGAILGFAVLDLITSQDPLHPNLILEGFTSGLSRISTSILPIKDPGWIAVSPVIFVGAISWATGKVSKNATFAPWCIFFWVLNFTIATAFGAGSGGAVGQYGIVLAVAILFWLGRSHRSKKIYVDSDAEHSIARQFRRIVSSLLVTSLVLGSAYLLVGKLVQNGTLPVSIVRQNPDLTLQGSNPSLQLATLRYSSPATSLYRVNIDHNVAKTLNRTVISGNRSVFLIPVASLAKYDGQQWSLEKLFPVLGGDAKTLVNHQQLVPVLENQPVASLNVTVLKGAVDNSLGRLLPSPGGLLNSVTGTQINADPAGGFGVSATPLQPNSKVNLTGQNDSAESYSPVDSSWNLPPKVCAALLAYLGLERPGANCPYNEGVLNAQKSITDAVSSLTKSFGVTPLKDVSGHAATDRTGQSYGDIISTIFGTEHMGTPEQYSTLVVLLARAVGLNARLETGFAIPARTGSITLKASDTFTWAEVYLGSHWVVENATPLKVGKGTQQSASISPPAQTNSNKAQQCSTAISCNPKIISVPKLQHSSPLAAFEKLAVEILALTALVLIALAIWATAIWQLKRRRYSKLLRGSPAERLRGTYLDLISRRIELRVAGKSPSASVTEIFDDISAQVSGDFEFSKSELIKIFNEAYFSTEADLASRGTNAILQVKGILKNYRRRANLLTKVRSALTYTRLTM